MAKVFISYRHTDPDQQLALQLLAALTQRGAEVFVDQQIRVGLDWVAEIERQIDAADFFVVLVSAESILSDMVRAEIRRAHGRKQQGELRILPVRVAFEGALPYDLGSYLDPIQYATWNKDTSFEPVIDQLVGAVTADGELPGAPRLLEDEADAEGLDRLAGATDERGAPLPVADPRLETGTLDPASPFYLRRPEDDQLERLVQHDGETLVIKAPRQFGKSSLMARARSLARDRSCRTCVIDFQLIDEAKLESLDGLCRFLAHKMARGFRTSVKPRAVWDDDLGPKESLTLFIEDAVLAEDETPVLLCLDEADRVFDRAYRDDFFTTVRGWHNKRAEEDLWKRLSLVVVHSTNATLWIRDKGNSPFNVGYRFRLPAFDASHVIELNARHGHPVAMPDGADRLLDLLGGQPYLLRQAFYTLATTGLTLDELDRTAATDRGPFGDHLRQHVVSLRQDDRLQRVMRDIVHGRGCDDNMDFERLSAAGLVRGESRTSVTPACDLYRRYFREHL